MCGITCVLSKTEQNICSFLLDSLFLLQNRGYDSAGILGVSYNDTLYMKKFASTNKVDSLKKLKNKVSDIYFKSAIGHTRWATHGSKTDINSHPHKSMNDTFYIVHNGIIENYITIKTMLLEKNYTFASQTDSEVISNLIEYFFSMTKNVCSAVKEACQMLEGTYGLAIICRNTPDIIYVIRNGSPLIIAENESMVVATSESAGLVNHFNHYMNVEANTLICISKQGIDYENLEKIKLNKTDFELSSKPYDTWTLKEIMEQPDSLLRSINNGGRIFKNEIKLGGIEFLQPIIHEVTNIILIGCGTSYNACMCAKYYFQNYSGTDVSYFDGAEFTDSDIPFLGNSIILLCSQSGETKDLHRCINIARNCQVVTVGIINVIDSIIAREVDCGIYLNARREVAVASTKSFTSMLVVLLLLSLWISQKVGSKKIQYNVIIDGIRALSFQSKKILNTICFKDSVLNKLNKPSLFLLGKKKMEAIAKEGALKIKEMAYIHAEGCNASSLKHGPFALLEKGFPVILLIDRENKDKMLNVYQELKSRDSYIFILSNLTSINIYQDEQTDIFVVDTNVYCQEILFTIVLQVLAYNLALLKNINPDKPKNLAKVVTVE